ncbi:C39 family peptidase [Thermophilibacter mediterraneus]|uniref:C39 family peptidase n=1 Tax=Thermophilibacter mediterraneus TaxID=1871031 RepID=UPI000ACF3D9C|nr:C39 family peptidase [Thermophilibacter mediterraneus]
MASRRRAAIAAVALGIVPACLAATLSVSGCAGEKDEQGVTEPVQIARADEATVSSTPRELWRKGSMPYLYQIDPEWADAEYAGGTFSETGCGPTALSMVYIYLTGNTDLDPVQMAQFSTDNGYATEGEGTSWTLMSEGAAQLGLSGQMIYASTDNLRSALEAGNPLVCVMNPGTFTEIGHFIVIERLGSDGKALVHDSNSVGRSMRTWDLDLICQEAAGVWVMSLA